MLNKCFTSLRLKLKYNYTLFEKYIYQSNCFQNRWVPFAYDLINIVMIDNSVSDT